MSDNKDQKTDKIKITRFTDLTDLDSTIRLDLGGNQNIVSTSSSPTETSSDDFDKTIDGLMDIEELLDNENNSDTTIKEEPTSPPPDDIDFGELDAGIDALSSDLLESAPEIDKAEPEGIKPDENSLDTLDKPFDNNDEAEAMFDFDHTNPPGLSDNENEFLLSSSDSLSMTADENIEYPSTEVDSQLDISEDIELDGNETTKETVEIEEKPPVIELTKEMLDEPESPLLPDLNSSQDSKDEINDENNGDNNLENIAETPELTTTETNVLADATAAIKEITEEEKEMAMVTEEPTVPQQIQSPVEQSGSSSSLPTLLSILGIAAGGFGAWMAYDASNQVADLERQIQNMKPAAKSEQAQNIADIQQRLTKIERRLTGTPTIEAAAPLGLKTSRPEKAAPETKAVIKIITPQTMVVETGTKSGDWVINLSSHAKESLAKREQARLKKIGLNAQIHTALVKKRTWYRVQITGFSNKEKAKAQLRDIQQKSAIQGAWVGKK